jgi:hypothetical protein|uniref:Uncharacterized protein n=1 Tax=Picea glauca TaxID=3330 RepID=A0A124GMF1_PICGL|nr:hypothetical protein ABT39_MTgene3392 [Picea glauca]KUM45465.1 hypothetical protein ABT39_MTgene2567 [Picea glauca]KUM45468.1 hypothetical protein ABT39_MTgene2570 [Picea glauca]QHR88999.1 hypothetical protein Q903MT_gene3018 [Picea sitchensis]
MILYDDALFDRNVIILVVIPSSMMSDLVSSFRLLIPSVMRSQFR